MSAPDLPRFKVASVTGYTPSTGRTGSRVSTAWYVLDTWLLHAVVSSYPVGGGARHGNNLPAEQRHALAERRCAELEAWHEQAMRDA